MQVGERMLILDGKVVSKHLLQKIEIEAAQFLQKTARKPHLSVIQVGQNPASSVYVSHKVKACGLHGFSSQVISLPDSISEEKLLRSILELNEDDQVDGILVQLPLPEHIEVNQVLATIAPEKDSDGFTFQNFGERFTAGSGVAPCTPAGIIEILKHYQIPLKGQHAVVVGRSNIVGKPVSLLLLEEGATVSICHSQTKNLSMMTQMADLVIVAAGRPHLLGQKDFKAGAVVIDVGIHRDPSGLIGDVDPIGLDQKLSARSPVPGGVGPMTIAMLLKNTMKLAQASQA